MAIIQGRRWNSLTNRKNNKQMRKNKFSKLNKDNIETIVNLYINTEKSAKEISQIFNISQAYVTYLVKKDSLNLTNL